MLKRLKKSTFFKNAFAYSGTNVISQFITLIRGFVVRRILPPEIMGFWNFVGVVQGFIGTFDLGCINGANRELPIMRGKDNHGEKTRIRSTTLLFTLLQNILIGMIASFYVYMNRANYVPWETIAAYVGIITFLIIGFQAVHITFLTTAQAFVPLSKLFLVGSIIDGISIPFCAYVWRLSGVMVMTVISACLKTVLFYFLAQKINIGTKLRIYKDTLKRLLSFGFFLRIVDYPGALFSMVNVLWVTKFSNIEALALFSMANGFFLQVSDISTRVGTVYTMRYLEQVGSGTPHHVLAKQMKQYLLFQLLVVIPLLSWASFFGLTFIVNNFIPKYSGANETFLILLMCSFFYVLNSGLTNPWMVEKKLFQRGVANIFGLLMMAGAIFVQWFFFQRQTINDIAYASVTGYYLYFVYMVIAVGKSFWRLGECIEIIISVSIGATWTYFILHASYESVGKAAGFADSFKTTVLMALLTLIALFPVTIYGLKRSRILSGWSQS